MNKTAALTALAITGAGAVGGITYAAVGTPAVASDATTATSTASPGTAAQGAGRLGRRALLNRLEHGELTLRAGKGDRTVDVQRGRVTAVSPTSITVASQDGYTHSYGVTSGTRVRAAKAKGSIGNVHSGDTVFVVASGGSALRIVDRS